VDPDELAEPDAGVKTALGVFPETCPLQELSKRSAAAAPTGTIRREEREDEADTRYHPV
jgi:hypothetical protein